jgi:di-heme cytochrome c peroxidase
MLDPRGEGRPTPLPRLSALLGRAVVCALALLVSLMIAAPGVLFGGGDDRIDRQLTGRLGELGFTGRIESTLPQRLGRPIDKRLAKIGRLLWFDTITGLNGDNTCAGCHSPTNGFGDSQPIAIGIDNNGIVGPDRNGPPGRTTNTSTAHSRHTSPTRTACSSRSAARNGTLDKLLRRLLAGLDSSTSMRGLLDHRWPFSPRVCRLGSLPATLERLDS